jgi:hypothetical protein
MSIWISSSKGDFLNAGGVEDSQIEIIFSHAFAIEEHDGNSLRVFLKVETAVGDDIKLKLDESGNVSYKGSFAEGSIDGKLVSFSLTLEDYEYETEYQGKKKNNKKEKKAYSAHIGKVIKETIGLGKEHPFKGKFIFSAPESLLTCLETGKNNKGDDLAEPVLDSFKDACYSIEPLGESLPDDMAKADTENGKSGGKGNYKSPLQRATERLDVIKGLLELEADTKPLDVAYAIGGLKDSEVIWKLLEVLL